MITLSLVFFLISGMIVLTINSDHMLLIRSGMVVNKKAYLPFYYTPMPFFIFKK